MRICVLLVAAFLYQEIEAQEITFPHEQKLTIDSKSAFVWLPDVDKRVSPQPWIMYGPNLAGYPDKHEKWMHSRFLEAGVAVAGINVGEGYGSPEGSKAFALLHDKLTRDMGFSKKPCLLGRSRGGLWVTRFASDHPDKVSGIAGIYPVFDFRTYPGLEKAAVAYGMTATELTQRLSEFNPIDRAPILAKARIPAFLIHGALDEVVPLRQNSIEFVNQYRAEGAENLATLEIVENQGHNFWEGFFRSQKLVDFAIARAKDE